MNDKIDQLIYDEVAELLKTHQKQFLVWARGFCKNDHLAEDFVQEAFLRYINYRQKGGVVLKSPRSWFYRVLKNLVNDHFVCVTNRQRIEIESGEDISVNPSHLPAPDRLMIGAENSFWSHSLINQLPARDARIVKAKYLHHQSYREIAEAEEMTVAHVGVTLNHALKKLRSLYFKSEF